MFFRLNLYLMLDNKESLYILWYFFKNFVKHYLVRKALTFVAASLYGIDAGLMAFNKGFSFYEEKKEKDLIKHSTIKSFV